MAEKTKIEWTDATWNPITGCSVVSPGCTNCYAMRLAGTRLKHHPSREGLTTMSKAGPVWNGEVRLNKQALIQPLEWKRPRMIFVCAHGDLFAENVPDAWIDQVFAVMALAPQHTFQVLTKRPERMRKYLSKYAWRTWGRLFETMSGLTWLKARTATDIGPAIQRRWDKPLENLWVGVSIEDQPRADHRVPILLDTPAAVRFISAEPMLGGLRLSGTSLDGKHQWNWLTGLFGTMHGDGPDFDYDAKIDWVIVGGESGLGARPMHPDWARSLRDQCAVAGVPFFFKQWGNWLPWEPEQGPCWKAQNGSCEDAHNLFPTEMDGDPKWDNGLSFVANGLEQFAFQNVGKKAAGRKLDGVEHNAMPIARPGEAEPSNDGRRSSGAPPAAKPHRGDSVRA